MSTQTLSTFFAVLTVIANAVVLVVVVSWALGKGWAPAARLVPALRGTIGSTAIYLAWGVAVVSTLGSLYYSEVANFPPCDLCWYQRIAMYPLAVILGIAAFRDDVAVRWYVWPLTAIGAAIALYHYQLEWFPDQGSFCAVDNPCTVVWVREFGYISIAWMAFSGFTLIATLLALATSAGESDEG
jgi:disulfide bond formation protein DsbB